MLNPVTIVRKIRMSGSMLARFHVLVLMLGLSAGVLAACDADFALSPYESDIDSDMRNVNARNIAILTSQDTHAGRSFKFAFISDTHRDYDVLEEAVAKINNRNDLSFVIVGGDVTAQGLRSEYVISLHIIENLDIPFVVIIGNHDALCNGKSIYHKMFGEYNFSFVFEKCKFVFLNSNALEFVGEAPDFIWLENELRPSGVFDQVVQISHVPVKKNEVFSDTDVLKWQAILESAGVKLSLHGHDHEGGYYALNGISYFITHAIYFGTYDVITIYPDHFIYERCADGDVCQALP